MVTVTPPWAESPFQCLITPSVNKFLPMSNLNLSYCSFRLCSLILSIVTWEKGLKPHLAPASFQGVVESDEVSLKPP